MTSGIVLLNFKEDINPEKIQDLVMAFYRQNKDSIESMEYNEFEDKNVLESIKTHIKSISK